MDNLTAFVIALTALVAASGGFIKLWYDLRQVHTIVNSQRSAMEARIEELRTLLQESLQREQKKAEGDDRNG